MERRCRNPRCNEPFGNWERFYMGRLCPSCRLAARYGAALAFGIAVVIKLVLLLVEMMK